MPARKEYYHARKIDAQRFGLSPVESNFGGNFFSALTYVLSRYVASRLKKRSVMPAM